MKRMEMTRELKEQLWKLFDRDALKNVTNLTIDGHRIPDEAVAKQRELWAAHRARNPVRT